MGLTTLEGQGPNKSWPMDANCRTLGYMTLTENASANPSTQGALASQGPNKLGTTGSPLQNDVIRTNDTQILAVPPDGTTESSLDKWSR